jgi:hypothetical protein
MPFKKTFTIFCLSLFLLSGLYAQQPGEMSAYRLEPGEVVDLDGRLEEGFWSKVGAATAFRQQEPLEGQLASEQTSVQIAFDDKNLYIGVRLFDSEPDKIKAFQKRRDAPLDTDDMFAFILDTYNDQRSAFYFEINPLGLMGDGILRTGQGAAVNRDWNGIWRAWVTIDDKGWSAEIRIPFMTLNFDPNNGTWGIIFSGPSEEKMKSRYGRVIGETRALKGLRMQELSEAFPILIRGLDWKPFLMPLPPGPGAG